MRKVLHLIFFFFFFIFAAIIVACVVIQFLYILCEIFKKMKQFNAVSKLKYQTILFINQPSNLCMSMTECAQISVFCQLYVVELLFYYYYLLLFTTIINNYLNFCCICILVYFYTITKNIQITMTIKELNTYKSFKFTN